MSVFSHNETLLIDALSRFVAAPTDAVAARDVASSIARIIGDKVTPDLIARALSFEDRVTALDLQLADVERRIDVVSARTLPELDADERRRIIALAKEVPDLRATLAQILARLEAVDAAQ